MKPKEDILREVINETIGNPNTEKYENHIHQEIALKAMEKYANESIKFYYEGLMSDFNLLLKDFYLWIDRNYALGMLTDKSDDVIKEYLKHKEKGKTLKSTHN